MYLNCFNRKKLCSQIISKPPIREIFIFQIKKSKTKKNSKKNPKQHDYENTDCSYFYYFFFYDNNMMNTGKI